MTSKYYLLKITGNLTGGTIFLTSKNYRITNHRPQTKIFTNKNIVSVFPPLDEKTDLPKFAS